MSTMSVTKVGTAVSYKFEPSVSRAQAEAMIESHKEMQQMSIINGYGKQVGVIVFGGAITNERAHVAEYTARGYVVIWCGDHARIHEANR